jgi:hypothetical protein
MSRDDDDDDYLDDPEIRDFNENLDARAAQQMEEGVISPLMFGTTGRGSPEMELLPENKLFRNAAKALRSEGMNDDMHLLKPRMVPINEQQKKEAEDEKQLDKMLDNMYKEMKKPAKSSVRSMSDSKLSSPTSKKGGTRKRSRRSRSRSRRGGAYKKRTMRKRVRKNATRRRR